MPLLIQARFAAHFQKYRNCYDIVLPYLANVVLEKLNDVYNEIVTNMDHLKISTKSDFVMPIFTKRLMLRPLQKGDGKFIFDAVKESKTCLEHWLPWPKHVKTWEDSEQFAQESYVNFTQRKSLNLGIFVEEKFIGVCGFNYFLWDIPSTEIGYWCRVSAQNNGYMKEAVASLVLYGFENLGIKRQVINCLEDNRASAAIAERLGFDLETRALGLLPNPQGNDLTMCLRYVKIKSVNATHHPGQILKSSEQDQYNILKKLSNFNQHQVPDTQDPEVIPLHYHIRNEKDEIIAGINAVMYAWGIVAIDVMFVEDSYRSQGLGRQLLQQVENEAKQKGASLIHLDTFDFQAKDFYLKQGFQVFGTLENCPLLHKRFYLKKILN